MPGRPEKKTVDYFPHDTEQKRTLFILKSRWGNDGYAFWFQLLEILGHTNGHYYDCSVPENWEYLLAYTGINEVSATEIIKTLSKLNAVCPVLWEKHKILWSDNFLERILYVYDKRSNPPQKPYFRDGKYISDTENTGEGVFPGSENGEEKRTELKRTSLTPRFLIPLKTKEGKFEIFEEDITEYQETFPYMDVYQALLYIRQWNKDNPSKRKSKRGIKSHITRFLKSLSDQGKYRKEKGAVNNQQITCKCGQILSLKDLKMHNGKCPVCGERIK